MKPDGLTQDLAQLRRHPGVDLATLRVVDGLIDKHAGSRVTLSRGQALAERMNIARCVSATAESRPQAVGLIMGATAVSSVTAYRYLLTFEREAAAARKARAGG